MSIVKRIFLFLVVNFLVVITITFLLQIFHVTPFLTAYGLDYKTLIIFCSLWGMGGAFISLLLSKTMAKWMMGVKIIDPNDCSENENSLFTIVERIAQDTGLDKTPEIGIYNSPEINAFATGSSKNSSLIAVSSGLMNRMNEEELKGVLGHEISHINSGDMVTMTLIQGVANAFVMFLARVLGFVLSGIGKDKNNNGSSYMSYYLFVHLFEFVFMILATIPLAAFSRYREYRADANSARSVGKENMIAALKKLLQLQNIKDPELAKSTALNAFKISTPRKGMLNLFATHPPLEERIARLENE